MKTHHFNLATSEPKQSPQLPKLALHLHSISDAGILQNFENSSKNETGSLTHCSNLQTRKRSNNHLLQESQPHNKLRVDLYNQYMLYNMSTAHKVLHLLQNGTMMDHGRKALVVNACRRVRTLPDGIAMSSKQDFAPPQTPQLKENPWLRIRKNVPCNLWISNHVSLREYFQRVKHAQSGLEESKG